MALNLQRQRFVNAYVNNGGNAMRATVVAGYSAKTAAAIASRLLRCVEVRQAIAAARQRMQHDAGITSAQIAQELGRLAFASIGDVVRWTKTSVDITPSTELGRDVLASIVEVSEHVDAKGRRTVRVKMHSKTQAIALLVQQLSLADLAERFAALEAKVHEMEGTRHARDGRLA